MKPDVRPLVETIRKGEGPDRRGAIAGLFRAAQAEDGPKRYVAEACLALRQRDELSLREIEPYVPVLLAYWIAVFTRVAPLQKEGPDTEWLLEDEYQEPRAEAEVLLDLFGFLPPEPVVNILEQALRFSDARLKCFAVTSLLRLRQLVDPDEIERVAASGEMRMIFMRQLRQLDMKWLMPEPWCNPEMLASSDLVRWAAHPNELGVPPEEIELMKTFRVASDEGPSEHVYLFRFREYARPWAPGEGWMAGIAGPIRDGEALDSPWSSFTRWDSMSPDQHFNKLYYRGGCH